MKHLSTLSDFEKEIYKRVSDTSKFHNNNRYSTCFGLTHYSAVELRKHVNSVYIELWFLEGCEYYFESPKELENFTRNLSFDDRDKMIRNNSYKGLEI